MRVRPFLAAAIAVAALPAVATAAPKACNLVKDPKGDYSRGLVGDEELFPADSGLDLLGADVASGSRNITAVFRLAAAPTVSPLYVSRYIVSFKVAGLPNKVVLAAARGVDGTTFSYGFVEVNETTGAESFSYPGTATGSITGATVTVTAPLADLAGNEDIGLIRRNAKISAITALTNRRLPAATASPRGQLVSADEATGKGSYLAGQPSCVKTS